MSGPQELHVHFRHQSTNYDLHLVKGDKSDHSVEINGVTYSVLGDEEKLKKACEILNSVSLDSISNSQDLQGRLSLREDLSFSTEKRVFTQMTCHVFGYFIGANAGLNCCLPFIK